MRVTGFICGMGVCLALAGGEARTAEPWSRPAPTHPATLGARSGTSAVRPGYPTFPYAVPARNQTLPDRPRTPETSQGDVSAAAPGRQEMPDSSEPLDAGASSGTSAGSSAASPAAAGFQPVSVLPAAPLSPGLIVPWQAEEEVPATPEGTAPAMIGAGFFNSATKLILVQSLADGSLFPATVSGVPVAARSQFFVGNNESPQPQDRIFLTFNWYHNVNKDALSRVPENVLIRDHRLISKLDVFYETFGFEKTFFGNWVSIGARVPFFQLQQREPKPRELGAFQIAEGLDQNTIGDASLVLKTVLAYDAISNSLLSGGLVVTLPTAPEIKVYDAYQPAFGQLGRGISTTIFQPWLGWFLDLGPVYVHGFSSISIPADDDDVYVWFLSGGVGWLLTPWFVPTLELHYFGPVNEGSDLYRQPVGAVEQLILTTGFHVPFYDVSTVTLGLSTPLTGPDTYDVGVVAQLNLRF